MVNSSALIWAPTGSSAAYRPPTRLFLVEQPPAVFTKDKARRIAANIAKLPEGNTRAGSDVRFRR
jgi:hypothetical protein